MRSTFTMASSLRRTRKTTFAIFSGYDMSRQTFIDMVTLMPALRSKLEEPCEMENLVGAFKHWCRQHKVPQIMCGFISAYSNLSFVIFVVNIYTKVTTTKATTKATRTRRRRTRRSHHSSCRPVTSTTRTNQSLKMPRTPHSHNRRRKTRPFWQIFFVVLKITVACSSRTHQN